MTTNVALVILGRPAFLRFLIPLAKNILRFASLACALGQVVAKVIHTAYSVGDIALAIKVWMEAILNPQLGSIGGCHK